MTSIVAFDPGVTGGMAWLIDAELRRVEPMPVFDSRVDGRSVADFIADCKPDIVVVELTQPMPKNGCIAGFKLGYNTGVLEGVISTLRHPIVRMTPSVWKKEMGLLKKDKQASLLLAKETWPLYHYTFKHAKQDGLAEAALIGLAYYKRSYR